MPLKMNSEMPSLKGAAFWLNGDQPDASQLKGQHTLIYVWSGSCSVCQRNMPHVQRWRNTYISQGLRMIGVHVPRMESDHDLPNLKATLAKYQISEPCAVDNERNIFHAFQTRFFPSFYLFDESGHLIQRGAGDYGVPLIEETLETVFPEKVLN
jgi:thioredoxin-related protein